MLEAAAVPERRDRELCRRIADNETQQAVVLELLGRLSVHPDETS